MGNIMRFERSAFDGQTIYDGSEPLPVASEPLRCAVDLMGDFDDMPIETAAQLLLYFEIEGASKLREDGGSLDMPCRTDGCNVTTTLKNEGGTIIATAGPGCNRAD
jgi:hypothetical protein